MAEVTDVPLSFVESQSSKRISSRHLSAGAGRSGRHAMKESVVQGNVCCLQDSQGLLKGWCCASLVVQHLLKTRYPRLKWDVSAEILGTD